VERLLLALGVVAATVAVLVWRGLTVTAGAVELGMLAVALVGFVATKPERDGDARVRGVVSRRGAVDVSQRARHLVVEDVEAAEDVTVRQDAGGG